MNAQAVFTATASMFVVLALGAWIFEGTQSMLLVVAAILAFVFLIALWLVVYCIVCDRQGRWE